jgi:hypothetical protein
LLLGHLGVGQRPRPTDPGEDLRPVTLGEQRLRLGAFLPLGSDAPVLASISDAGELMIELLTHHLATGTTAGSIDLKALQYARSSRERRSMPHESRERSRRRWFSQ